MNIIEVKNVTKNFVVRKRQDTLFKSFKSFILPEMHTISAVKNLNFSITQGERVAYIGPNGAGKSTTIKILSGILTPSSGEIIVNEIIPYQERQKNALQMGVVFGQRSQLYWDLPLIDTLDMLKTMYRIPDKEYISNLELLINLLELDKFMDRPVRQYSLGEKMRANLTAAFIHNPLIVYLDEPTIGLDVIAKETVRKFIKSINEKINTTIILTTHDMDDIEEICRRAILIDNGTIFYDGDLQELKRKYSSGIEVIFELNDNNLLPEDRKMTFIEKDNHFHFTLGSKQEVNKIIRHFLHKYNVKDIQIKETTLEDIIKRIYRK